MNNYKYIKTWNEAINRVSELNFCEGEEYEENLIKQIQSIIIITTASTRSSFRKQLPGVCAISAKYRNLR